MADRSSRFTRGKHVHIFGIVLITAVFGFLPFSFSFSKIGNGPVINFVETNTASALINLDVIDNKTMAAIYNEASNVLTLKLSGRTVAGVGLGGTYNYTYQLPEELSGILNHPNFKDAASIYYEVPTVGVLGIVIYDKGTISGYAFENLDSSTGIIAASKDKPLVGLSVGSEFEATLTINLNKVDIPALPKSVGDNEYLHFYSLVTSNGFIDVGLLSGNGAHGQIHVGMADVTPPQAPEVNEVTDQDTAVTGKGEPDSRVKVTIPDGKYTGTVAGDGRFTVDIPTQKAGTEVTVTLIDEAGNESEPTTVTVIEIDVTAPEAPVVNRVTDLDTSVTGTGEAGAIITVITLNGEYIGTVAEEGNFTVEIPVQKAGALITVTLTDEAGNKSEKGETIVKGVRLEFKFVPKRLPFHTTTITSIPMTIQRQDANWTIEVLDTREVGSTWNVTAKAEKPLTSVKQASHILTDALVYVDEQNNSHSLTEGTVNVYHGTKGTESVIPVNWSRNKGLLIQLSPGEAYAEEYSTTITWTLVDAP